MTSHDDHDTPLELRGLENRLRSLRPARDPELVRGVSLYCSVSSAGPLFSDMESLHRYARFVRRSQYHAGIFGALAGSLFGAVIGGLCVYCAMGGLDGRLNSHPIVGRIAAASPYSVISHDEGVPDSVKRIVRYYNAIPNLSEGEVFL